ncbi:EF-hand calcium-binding domain-containing protein 14-like isoform X2 [Pecten maximus]|uniref:EF-hand calcium-binding domain-containing protein 14-like isoform X2 n=1 Tax=Pecten maximus TaxID=6579 RepID=UPI00145874C2|nr:EF-hand calcium-binding domain-containing protein 14-like isoform X2 [Pecten maximus]
MLDQQSKINVEFKPSKRMKKRRELDALVGNGKSRRKSKSGHELLRSDSESSEIDEFSLSAQKSFMRNKGHGSAGCSCITVFGIFLVGTCLLACVALLWMHFQMKRDLDEMRDKISSVESRNQNGLGDYQDLRNKVQTVNQTIQGIKAGGVTETTRMNQRLTNITNKIHQLSMTTESLQDGLKAAPEIKQIAMKVPVVVSTAAKLGVNVKSMQATVNDLLDFQKQTETELKTLMESVSKVAPTTSPGDSPNRNRDFEEDILSKFNAMTQTLAFVNSSLWSKIDILQQEVSHRQTKFMENATSFLKMTTQKSSDPDFVLSGPTPSSGGREGGGNSEEFTGKMETQVYNMVHQMIVDMELMNRTEADSKALDSLLSKMDNVTAIVQTLRDQFDQVKQDHASVVKSDESEGANDDQLNDMKQDISTQIQAINKTVEGLIHDFGAVTKHYLTIHSNQVKVMATVEGLKNYFGVMEKKINQLSASQEPFETDDSNVTNPVPKTESPQQTATVVNKPPVTNTPEQSPLQNDTVTVVSPTSPAPPPPTASKMTDVDSDIPSTQAPPPPPPPPTPNSLVKIPFITSFSDLDLAFSRWDKDGNELVSREDMNGFMPQVPSEEKLKPYDKNDDNLYSLDEMATAMGFTTPEEEPPTEETESNSQP